MWKHPSRQIKQSILAVFLVALCCNPTAAKEELNRLFGLGPVETFTIQSETLGRDFHIYVRLPLEYEGSACDWPVVYLLDGGILFPMLTPYQFMMEIDELAPPAVMVGISYGGLGSANGNYRSTDYTAPAEEPASFGGATAYQGFLADELIPRIEADYRIDQDSSLVLGQSLGGQFTLFTALTRPELFGFYLSINPALHRNLDYFKQLEPSERTTSTPILITRSTEEQPRLSGPLQQWIRHWQASNDDALTLDMRWLTNQHHASSTPAAYRQAMQWWPPAECNE